MWCSLSKKYNLLNYSHFLLVLFADAQIPLFALLTSNEKLQQEYRLVVTESSQIQTETPF